MSGSVHSSSHHGGDGDGGASASSPDIRFSAQVMKIGFDGTSLPRLVVVTSTFLYVCLLSGGITRTIDLRAVEYVSISSTGDSSGEHEGGGAGPDHGEHEGTAPQSTVASSSKRGSHGHHSGGGSGTPEKIAERIRRRFHRKKAKESATRDRQRGSSLASAAASATEASYTSRQSTVNSGVTGEEEEEDIAVIIATIGVQGEVALVLRFRTDDEAVSFADTMEQISEQRDSPIRFHLPTEMSSALASARTSPSRSATVSPTRASQPSRPAKDIAETEQPKAECARSSHSGDPDTVEEDEAARRAQPQTTTAAAEVVVPPVSAAVTEDRLRRWRTNRLSEAQPSDHAAAALPPPSYFSAATFGTRPDPASDVERPHTPSPDSTAIASLPSSSNSTSAPPSPVPPSRPRRTSTTDVEAQAVQTECPKPDDNATILEPLVTSSKGSLLGIDKSNYTTGRGDGEAVDDSAAYELELSPDAYVCRPPSVKAVAVPVELPRRDPVTTKTTRRSSPHVAESGDDENVPVGEEGSLYYHLYGATTPRRTASSSRNSRRADAQHIDSDHEDTQERLPRQSQLQPQPQPQSRFYPAPDVTRLLRIDEGLAEEMLAAREAARVAEAARQDAEERLAARERDVAEMECALDQLRAKHTRALEKQARKHQKELREVQEAFDAYDERMNSFLDKLQCEHEVDAAQWLAERRELKEAIKAKDEELERLAQLVAAANAALANITAKAQTATVPRDVVVVQPSVRDVASSSAHGEGHVAPASVPARRQGQGTFAGMVYLDTARGRAGADEPLPAAGYYGEAHERLQAKLAKYSSSHHTRAEAAREQESWRTDRYDLDEVLDGDAVVPSPLATAQVLSSRPQRRLRTPSAQVHGVSQHTPIPSLATQRDTTRALRFPDDEEDGEVGAQPRYGGGGGGGGTARPPRRLVSPQRE